MESRDQKIEAISKKSFRPIRRRRTSIGVEPSYQVLDILEYACGLILGLALISTENPNFEMASSMFIKKNVKITTNKINSRHHIRNLTGRLNPVDF